MSSAEKWHFVCPVQLHLRDCMVFMETAEKKLFTHRKARIQASVKSILFKGRMHSLFCLKKVWSTWMSLGWTFLILYLPFFSSAHFLPAVIVFAKFFKLSLVTMDLFFFNVEMMMYNRANERWCKLVAEGEFCWRAPQQWCRTSPGIDMLQ